MVYPEPCRFFIEQTSAAPVKRLGLSLTNFQLPGFGASGAAKKKTIRTPWMDEINPLCNYRSSRYSKGLIHPNCRIVAIHRMAGTIPLTFIWVWRGGVTQVLVFVSLYQGSILGTAIWRKGLPANVQANGSSPKSVASRSPKRSNSRLRFELLFAGAWTEPKNVF